MAVEFLERWKERLKKSSLPPPLLMAWPVKEELYFFAASLSFQTTQIPYSYSARKCQIISITSTLVYLLWLI